MSTILLHGPSTLVAIMTCVLTPVALRVVGASRLAVAALPTGAIAAASAWMAPGTWATILVAPYAIVCAVAAIAGARRLLARPWPPNELALHSSLVVLAGACVWLVAYRASYPLLGYPPLWVLLTAAHFHVAGAYLSIVVGHVARGRAQVIALGCVIGLPLTALGILVGGPLETVAALVMATSGFATGLLLLTKRGLLRLAALPLLAGMVLAAMYALRGFGTAITLGTLDPLSSMIVTHGVLDTLFAALALIAFWRGPVDRHDGR